MNKSELLGMMWEGFSASSRKEKVTISTPAMDVFQGRTGNGGVNLRLLELSSSDKDRGMDKAKKVFQLINPSKVVLIGKSLGGVCVKEFIEDYEYLLNRVEYKVLLIDPHGAMAGDGEIGPYNKNKPIFLNVKGNTEIVCIRQDKNKPTGAEVDTDSSNNVINFTINGFDHYNIIDAPEVRYHLNALINNLIWKG